MFTTLRMRLIVAAAALGLAGGSIVIGGLAASPVGALRAEPVPGSETPKAIETPKATEPEPTKPVEATKTPEPTEEPKATETPEATEVPKGTETPEATEVPKGTETPEAAPLGDVNDDSAVDAVDAELTLQFDSGLVTALPNATGADTNHDGVVNSIDAEVILQMVAGLTG